MEQMDCRYCGEGKMVEKTYSRKIKSGRAMLSVEGLMNWQCVTCKSEMTDAHQFEFNSDRIEVAEKNASGFVTVGMLKEFREKYSLSQRDASKLFGAGNGAFGKYESGGRISKPNAKLIKAACNLPDLVRMLADEEGIQIAAVKKSQSHESSLQDALSEATGSWMSDSVSIPEKLSQLFARSPCTNDNQDSARWANQRSMEFMLVSAR